MRRKERMMNENDAIRLLEGNSLGVLCTAGADGTPYGVPVNYCYVREENAVIFHCATTGRKMDNLLANARVSLTVVGKNRVAAEKLTTYYESVIVAGTASLVQSEREKILCFDRLCRHLTPGIEWRGDDGCRHLNAAAVVRIGVESITGKKNGEA